MGFEEYTCLHAIDFYVFTLFLVAFCYHWRDVTAGLFVGKYETIRGCPKCLPRCVRVAPY